MDTRILIAYTTVLELLTDRGYTIPQRLKFETVEALEKKFKDRNSIELQVKKKNDPADNIVIYFFGDPKPINIAFFRSRYKEVIANKVKSSIFISREPNAFTSTSLRELRKNLGNSVTVFNEKELAFNITKHSLVPRHELLSEEEKQQVLEMHQATAEQFPRLYISDPVSKYYGYQLGQLIRIHRKSESAGNYSHYRLVVPDPGK